MSDKELMTQVMEKISSSPDARKQLATAIGAANPAEVQRVAAQIGVELSAERAAQLTATVRGQSKGGYLFLT